MNTYNSVQHINKRCEEIRSFIIDHISKNGGYLSDNLSNVDICVVLENALNDDDILVCDDKILTLSLNQLSIKNVIYNNSNPLSYCLGLLDSNNYNHIYLLLNCINDDLVSTFVHLKTKNINYNKFTIIFNDNNNINLKFINRNIILDNPATNLIKYNLKRVRNSINNKSLDNIDNTILYLKNHNPFDTSVYFYKRIDDNINEFIESLNNNVNKINFIHYLSKKGKGYLFSQENPYKYFYTKPFNIATGRLLSEENDCNLYSQNIVGNTIEELLKNNNDICCLINNKNIDYGINNIIAKYTDKVIEKDLIYKRLINYGLALSVNRVVYMPILAKDFNENISLIKECFKVYGHLILGVINNTDIDRDLLNNLDDIYIYETNDCSDIQNIIYYAANYNKPVIILLSNKCIKYIKNDNFYEKKLGKWELLVNNDMKGKVIISSGVQLNNIHKFIIDNNLDITLINAGFISSIDEDIINNLYSNKCIVYVYNSVVEYYIKRYLTQNGIKLNIEYIGHIAVQELFKEIGQC